MKTDDPYFRARVLEIADPFIRTEEGCVLKAYHGAYDRPGVWTIGYGATTIDGRPVKEGDVITQEQADAMLVNGVVDVLDAVLALAPSNATENQCAALASFAFNEGVYALKLSTLVHLWVEGKTQLAAQEFPKWVYANGKVVPGLVARRKREMTLFLTP